MPTRPTDEELSGASYSKAAEGRNDPNYDKEIEETLQNKRTLEAQVVSVQVIDGYDPHVRVRAGRNVARARDVARAISDLSDAPLIDETRFRAPNGRQQPPRHTYYKDDQK